MLTQDMLQRPTLLTTGGRKRDRGKCRDRYRDAVCGLAWDVSTVKILLGDIVNGDAGIYGKYDIEVVSAEINYTANKKRGILL